MEVKWYSSGSQVRSHVEVLTTSFFVRTWQLPLYIYEDFFLHIYRGNCHVQTTRDEFEWLELIQYSPTRKKQLLGYLSGRSEVDVK